MKCLISLFLGDSPLFGTHGYLSVDGIVMIELDYETWE